MSLDPPGRPSPPPPLWLPRPESKGQRPLAPRRRTSPWVHGFLLLATGASTTYWGSLHYAAFQADFANNIGPISWIQGTWYSLTILAILGAHELGHYFACRYYHVDVSLPYFLPAPVPTGTIGAFIRIHQPIPTKRMLFDIGAAGPVAGFLVVVPALFLGLSLSRLVPLPDDFVGLTLGEPLLFRGAAWLVWGDAPTGYSINLHPVGFAAWFGLLATALNLFPIGQLDGGHISYAALGSRSTIVTFGGVAAIIGLTSFSLSWILWAAMIVIMLVAFGPRHPRTVDDEVPLDPRRRIVAIGTLAIFLLCFTPAPIEVTNFLSRP